MILMQKYVSAKIHALMDIYKIKEKSILKKEINYSDGPEICLKW
jgi:hypothetical protein